MQAWRRTAMRISSKMMSDTCMEAVIGKALKVTDIGDVRMPASQASSSNCRPMALPTPRKFLSAACARESSPMQYVEGGRAWAGGGDLGMPAMWDVGGGGGGGGGGVETRAIPCGWK
jgi:hypothetical protein